MKPVKRSKHKRLPNSKNIKIIYYILLVVLGAQTMILELAIPRLLSIVFGNTLFCWTAIIAVVLIALSLGYYLGGRYSSGVNTYGLIWKLSFLSSTWIVVLSILGDSITKSLSSFGIMLGPLVTSFILAAVPSGLAAAVVPLVVEVFPFGQGKAAGQCYAWSTIGSILGVFLTGYILLPQLGISMTMLAGTLPVFLVSIISRNKFKGITGIAMILIAGFVLLTSNVKGFMVDKSNGYHRIRIKESPFKNSTIRTLLLDSTVEGAVNMGDPAPILAYQKNIRKVLDLFPLLNKVLFLGGGSFSMPRYLKFLHPDTIVDVIEIDPDLVELAREYLELENKSNVNVIIGDGRRELRYLHNKYDLIVNDAFHGVRNIPFHLLTVEFCSLVKNKLTENGIYAINVIGHPTESSLLHSVLKTLLLQFKHVTVYTDPMSIQDNHWVLARQYKINLGFKPLTGDLNGMVLTDNHAPVEYLIATDLMGIN